VAFLQYTSGSTARPKGICISHSNLIANLTMIRDRMGIQTGEDFGVTWLPHYHDMGLVGSYLTTMFTRNTTWCLQPEDFALQPSRWLQLISEHHAGVCGSPDFAYRLCIEKTTDQQAAELDLSSWRVAYIGAERIRPDTLREFAEKFGPSGFRLSAFFPCYGLGETTLLACGGPPEAAPVLREVSTSALARGLIQSAVSDDDRTGLVGSGQTFEGSNIVIVDSKSGQRCGDDVIGEIFVSGPSVTCGYFQREDLNRQLFRDMVTGGVPGRYLQTGDLGFLSDGQLFITGRTREIIIIRGRNLSPEDIEERTGTAHQALQPGATVAFSFERNGQESLVIASELRRSEAKLENPEPVFEAIRQAAVAGSGVNPSDILLMRPASIPRTSSGKLKRLEVRGNYQNNTIDFLFREYPAT
jgi:acyl-CoA synthetase (AMP-forming)/AMP-acid ligase II